MKNNYNFDKTYLDYVSKILLEGDIKPAARKDQKFPGTVSHFGGTLVYDVSEYFPLLTTKYVYTNGINSELLWFLLGDSDLRPLVSLNNTIWNGDAFRRYVKENNIILEKSPTRKDLREFGKKILKGEIDEKYADLGPVYGFNLRFFGGDYVSSLEMPFGNYKDQLKEVFNLIKNSPSSRRIQFIYLNPENVDKAILPPCHLHYQFNIVGDYIDLAMTQRSADMFLGVPFNIASSTLLLYLVANTFGLKPRKFVHHLNDSHVYFGLGWDDEVYDYFESLREKVLEKYAVEFNNGDYQYVASKFLEGMVDYLKQNSLDVGHLEAFYKQLQNKPSFYPKLVLPKDLSLEEITDLKYSFRKTNNLETTVNHLREFSSIIGSSLKGYDIVKEDKSKRINAMLYAGW